MKRSPLLSLVLATAILVSVGAGCVNPAPTPTPTRSVLRTPTATPLPSPTPTVTLTHTPTPTSTPTPRPTNTPRPTPTTASTPAPSEPFAMARPHHYRFAHLALPTLFHEDPKWVINTLNQDGMAFLQFAWDRVGQDVDAAERLASDGLDYEIRKTDDGMTIVLITLPEPKGTPEAYFVAMVYCARQCPNTEEETNTRVFTLEYNLTFSEKPITILGEWTSKGTHLNYGPGTEPDLDAFYADVLSMLTKGREPAASSS